MAMKEQRPEFGFGSLHHPVLNSIPPQGKEPNRNLGLQKTKGYCDLCDTHASTTRVRVREFTTSAIRRVPTYSRDLSLFSLRTAVAAPYRTRQRCAETRCTAMACSGSASFVDMVNARHWPAGGCVVSTF